MKINSKEVNITDFIQAIAAALAIPAAIVGIFALFIRDVEKEKQINSLVELANQSQKQTEFLSNQLIETNKQTQELILQTEEMVETNKLFQEQIKNLSDQLKVDKKRLDVSEKNQRLNFLPEFRMNEKESGENKFSLITNIGRTCLVDSIYFRNCIQHEEDSIGMMLNYVRDIDLNGAATTITHFSKRHAIYNGKSVDFEIHIWKDNIKYEFELITCDLVFAYTDMDGNKYEQEIDFQLSANSDANYYLNITKPPIFISK